MTTRKHETTSYLPGEGRAHMQECLQTAFKWSKENHVGTIVIFTGTGDGPLYAAQNLMPEAGIDTIVAVTPPPGRPYRSDPLNQDSEIVRAGVTSEVRQFLVEMGVTVVSAHLPFKPIQDLPGGSPWSGVEAALSIMGGGFPLCVQAALIACDAGAVRSGERIVVATADTAISVIASRTETFISKAHGLLVEHIICRPRKFDISKSDHHDLDALWGQKAGVIDVVNENRPPIALPPTDDVKD